MGVGWWYDWCLGGESRPPLFAGLAAHVRAGGGGVRPACPMREVVSERGDVEVIDNCGTMCKMFEGKCGICVCLCSCMCVRLCMRVARGMRMLVDAWMTMNTGAGPMCETNSSGDSGGRLQRPGKIPIAVGRKASVEGLATACEHAAG